MLEPQKPTLNMVRINFFSVAFEKKEHDIAQPEAPSHLPWSVLILCFSRQASGYI